MRSEQRVQRLLEDLEVVGKTRPPQGSWELARPDALGEGFANLACKLQGGAVEGVEELQDSAWLVINSETARGRVVEPQLDLLLRPLP